ncbi:MAG: hypothetical protein JNK38_10510 [Acidobacteria bacterium]|nr:hypothetical protein [Acidobacteriota bacterium]
MFTGKKQYFCRLAIAMVVALGLMTPIQASCPQVIPNGSAYQKLAADWWKWAFSFPTSINPLFDETGSQAYLGDRGNVFFLAGVYNVTGTATRTVTVPAGKPLFFPVLNSEYDNVLFRPPYLGGPITPPPQPNPLSVPELYAASADVVALTSELHATVDGCSIPGLFSYRAKSAPFSFRLPATDNIYQFFGVDVSGTVAPAITDGYWLFLQPLPPGNHTVNFGGTFGAPVNFTLDITYHITVMP